ncbi:MAG: histidine kinase [Bacteroidetes bacterium]|nr:histidine kinase [Bacteroidota bacterium]
MCLKKRCLFIWVLFFVSTKISAQTFNFINYTVDDGLPYIQISSIYQDDKGYLWTGGYGGLSKFNGTKFINYTPRKGLVNYWVTAISQNNKNKLAVGTLGGLSVFYGNEIKNYTTQNGLPDNYIYALAAKNEEIAIATKRGIAYLNGEHIVQDKRFAQKECILIKSNANKYIAANKKELFWFNDNKVQMLYRFAPNSDTIITSFEIDKNTTLWIGTNYGLFSIPNYEIQSCCKKIATTDINQPITCLYADYKNILWVGTARSLIKYENHTTTMYQPSKEESGNFISYITSDYEQNIWIGTHSGLFKFRDEGLAYFGFDDGLKNTFIQTIVCDKDNALWFGTGGGGVYKRANHLFTHFSTQNKIPHNYVSALVVDSLNRVWIGTAHGLCYAQNNVFHNPGFLQNEFVRCLFIDKKDNMWAGLQNKIACIKNIYSKSREINYYSLPLGKESTEYQVSSVCQDEKGTLYVASFLGGLFRLDGGKITDITQSFGLKTRAVLDVKTDNNYLYIATLDGISLVNLQTKKTQRITEEDGLSSNLVYSVLLSNGGQTLWAGTNQGANKIDLKSFFQSGEKNIISLGKAEGFNGLECNTGGLSQDAKGNIWFGTVNGLVKYSPTKFLNNENEAKLSFTGMKLFYDDTLLPKKAALKHYENNIRFDFMGICLTNPEKVLYTHWLEGFENQWSPPSTQNNVTYSNLPPGVYTLKVKCCNNQGLWNKEPLIFSFSIQPPYWKRWWFIALVVLFAILLVVVIFRIRLYQLKTEQEQKSKMQIEIAKNELKALRAQMNPHFLFNSLNSIQHFILTQKTDDAVFYLNRFSKLMRTILNNSEKAFITLKEEIEALQLYIELEKMRFNNSFTYNINVDERLDIDYEQIPAMLLQPYIENAILHGLMPKGTQGALSVRFFIENQQMCVCIEDNGIGRKKAAELKNQSRKNHQSIGMKIMSDRLKLLSEVQGVHYAVSILDLYDAQQHPIGTKVEIRWDL